MWPARARFSLCLLCASLASSVGRAQVRPFHELEGSFWDLQFVGAAGAGLDAPLARPVMAQLRAGAGYATEPWFFNGGLTATLGGLGELAGGLELEVNHLSGLFIAAGAGYSQRRAPLVHATLGFAIAGLQYQYLPGAEGGRHALLGVIRLPIGTWWFIQREQRSAQAAAARLRADRGPAPRAPVPDERIQRRRASLAREQAETALARGELQLAQEAFARSLSFFDDPAVRLARSRLEESRGHFVAARDDIDAALERAEELSLDAETIASLQSRRAELSALVGLLRVAMPDCAGARVEVDGEPAPALVQGYDRAVDPGRHQLSAWCEIELLLEIEFEAQSGEISRISVPPPGSPAP